MKDIREREVRRFNGYLFLFLAIALIVATSVIFGLMIYRNHEPVLVAVAVIQFVVLLFVSLLLFIGLKAVRPNEAYVFSLFGKYYGTLKEEGFWFVNPFLSANTGTGSTAIALAVSQALSVESIGSKGSDKRVSASSFRKTVSLKVQTFVNGVQKVNDKLGNPIMVGAVVIWKITNPTKAVFVVDDYKEYLSNQADSIIRNVARLYPYDNMDENESDEASELSLKGSSREIAEKMKLSLQDCVKDAGIEIIDVRINQLAYAEEIASAMLQRQQAVAIIAARKKIVEGAVSMVEMALAQLKEDGVVALDEERKAQMVSNLLVVLCGNKEAQPIVNSGSIY